MPKCIGRLVVSLALPIVMELLLGCGANPYKKFFVSFTHDQPVSGFKSLVPHHGEPEVYSGQDPERDYVAMVENGFGLVGYSSFNAPPQSLDSAKAQARQIQAAVVLLYSQYTNTLAGTIPFVIQGPAQTATTQSSGTFFGNGQSVNYHGTSTTTVPGQTTYNIPYAVNRYDQVASYWVRTKPPRLGLDIREPTQEERSALGGNRGVVVRAVIKGSPAFLADFLRGDVVLVFGDQQIRQAADFIAAVDRYAGTEVDLVTLRAGEERRVHVRLNPTSY